MNETDQLALLAELDGEHCGLSHGSWQCENDQAVDVLVIPIGYNISEVEQRTVRELTIFLCKDCAETLHNNDKDWICFICTNCGGSTWKIRRLLKKGYSSDILQLMKYCPNCHGKAAC